METQLPFPKKGAQLSQISAHACCGQMAAWIKMPLGTKVGFGLDRIVFRRDLAPPPKRGTAPNFRPMPSPLWAPGP